MDALTSQQPDFNKVTENNIQTVNLSTINLKNV
jgi:hypothetical protein